MSDQRVYLDDIYGNKKCGGSVFRAIVMMAHEARFINEQARLGFLQLTKKPTTIAMYKFKENKLTIVEKTAENQEPSKKAPDASFEVPGNVDFEANDAFGE